jgi:peptidoglycan-associated lipoprotein
MILPFVAHSALLHRLLRVTFLNEASARRHIRDANAGTGAALRTGERMQLSRCRRAGAGLFLSLMAALALAACSNSPKPESDLVGGRNSPATPGSQRDFAVNVGDLVYFASDSSDLSPEAQQTLTNQARWLQQYAQYTITIEGHADERGTREYNIALGAKRAQAVRTFLAQHGINGQRLRTVSYGKERPVAVCNDISCWSQNRRAQTVLNSRHEARS